MQPTVMAPLLLTLLAGGGFMVNEWSHGGLSESLGMGHRHMLDYHDLACEKHGPWGHTAQSARNSSEPCGHMDEAHPRPMGGA